MMAFNDMPTEAEMNPSVPAPLLYQLAAYLMGQQSPTWKAGDYATGLGTGPLSSPGSIAALARAGKLTRPWPGVKSPFSNMEQITQPVSYASPTTTELPSSATDLKSLLQSLGGSYSGVQK